MSALSVATVRRWNSSYLSFIWPSYSTTPSYQFCTLKAPLTESKADSDSFNPESFNHHSFRGLCSYVLSCILCDTRTMTAMIIFLFSVLSGFPLVTFKQENTIPLTPFCQHAQLHNSNAIIKHILNNHSKRCFFFSLGRPVWFWGKCECLLSSFALLLSWYKNPAATQW